MFLGSRPYSRCQCSQPVDLTLQGRLRHRVDEHPFGARRGQGAALRRPAGLEDHRGPLRRRLPLGEPGHPEVAAVVVDVVDAGGVDVDPPLGVADDGVVVPGVLPELVADLEVLGGHVVALVMGGLLAGAEVAGSAVGVGGDQVPAHAAAGEVVEAREAPGHRVRVVVGGRARDAEAQVAGHARHRRDDEERVDQGDLGGVGERADGLALVDVVVAGMVGEEDAVEAGRLQQLRVLGPEAQVPVAVPAVVARAARGRRTGGSGP